MTIPVLRLDNDNNILGLYPKDVPGPEVKSVSIIPDNKAMLVLKDLSQTKIASDDGTAATEKLIQRRMERKMKTAPGN